MSKISLPRLASYAVDELEKGVASNLVAQKISSYLLEERQTREYPKVLRAIEQELARRGSEQVVITSAHAVSEDTKKQLARLLGAENPTFHEVIDASVIGGVKAKSGETEIDLTVRGRLNNFRAKIVNQN